MCLTSTAPYTYEQRLAASKCIQGFIHDNDEGRTGLLQRIIDKYHDKSAVDQSTNLLYYILDVDDSTRKDPYRIWFACTILLHLLDSSSQAKALVREISIGDVSEGEEPVSALQQINANLSTALINSFDPRIAIGFLMLLSIWLYDDCKCVEEFLEETAGIQTLVGSIAQAREGVFVTGLAAVLLGICVEFNSPASPLPPAKVQKLIVSGVGGKEQFVFRITQFRESSEFRDFREQVTFSSHGDDDLPDLWFDLGFVEFLKDNYSMTFSLWKWLIQGRIQRSVERSPESFDATPSTSRPVDLTDDRWNH
jgi:intracellular protein transport protein USO1